MNPSIGFWNHCFLELDSPGMVGIKTRVLCTASFHDQLKCYVCVHPWILHVASCIYVVGNPGGSV